MKQTPKKPNAAFSYKRLTGNRQRLKKCGDNMCVGSQAHAIAVDSSKGLYNTCARPFESIVKNNKDKAVLSHWYHLRNTRFGQPVICDADKLFYATDESWGRVHEILHEQLLIPGLMDVPFPSQENPCFSFVDIFAGVGGFRMALQKLGGLCVFSSEWNEAAQQSYFTNYGEFPFGDITKPETKTYIPDGFDVLCAGFPCQPFSISGKMRGFDDVRGTLFFDVCEIIRDKHPQVVFLENVKHLIHHRNGTTLRVILDHIRKLGYKVEWRLLNASDFGVAQNRERIVIIATRDKPFDFDAIKANPRIKLEEILDADGDFEYLNPKDYTLLSETREQASGLIFVGYRNKKIRKAGVRTGTEHLSRVHKQPNRIYSVKGIHPTLPSQEASGRFFILLNDGRVRKLTINECYKLMGFPTPFIKSVSPSAQYLQIGNSVCVPMIEAVGTALIKQQFIGGGL